MEVTLFPELATPIQEEAPDKTQRVILVLAVILTSIPVEPILLVIPTRTLLEATHPQVVIQIKIQLEEDIPTRTLLQEATQLEVIPISIQVVGAIPVEPILEVIQIRTLLEATHQQVDILTNTQRQEVTQVEDIPTKGPRTSTQELVATLSEPEIQDRAGVSQVRTQGRIPAEGLVDTQTGTQITRFSVPAMVEEVTFQEWEGLPSLVPCRVWDTNLRPQALPKKPYWQQVLVPWLEWLSDTDSGVSLDHISIFGALKKSTTTTTTCTGATEPSPLMRKTTVVISSTSHHHEQLLTMPTWTGV